MHSQHNQVTTATAWRALPDVDDVEPRGPQDDALFAEIKSVLQKHGALHRFGIALNHRHFHLNDGEVIYETTDVEGRRQVLEPRLAADVIGTPRVLETQWLFDGANGTVVCVGFCHYDRGHRRIHNQK